MDENELDGRLLVRYISGDCTPEERAVVRVWMHESEKRREFLNDVREIWEASDQSPEDRLEDEVVDVDSDWERLRGRIEAAEEHKERLGSVSSPSPPNGRQQRTSGTSPARHAMRVAAVVSVLVATAVLVGQYWESSPAGSPAETAAQKVITEPGQRATVRLGDGTRVMLNVDSELEVPPSFNQTTRTVQLKGEAYFDVVHTSDHPFVIRSGNAEVEVLGTKFAVEAYSEERVRVVVEEGTVSMAAASAEEAPAVQLGAGQLGRIIGSAREVDVTTTNIENYLGWRSGQLVFQQTPLSEVVKTLERWYDIDGAIEKESLKDLRLTADLKSRSLQDVVKVIAVSLHVDYELTSGRVVFTGRKHGNDLEQSSM